MVAYIVGLPDANYAAGATAVGATYVLWGRHWDSTSEQSEDADRRRRERETEAEAGSYGGGGGS